MGFRKFPCLVLIAATLACGAAKASPIVLFSDLGTGSSVYSTNPGAIEKGSGVGGNNISQARAFTVSGLGDFEVTQIDLGVLENGGLHTFMAAILNSNAGTPGSVIGSWNLATSASTCCALVTQTGITGITLTGGMQYFMEIAPQTLGDSSDNAWQSNTVGATSVIYGSLNGGASWINDGVGLNAAFDVLGVAAPTSVPEPSSLALAAGGLVLLAGFGRRKSRTRRSSI